MRQKGRRRIPAIVLLAGLTSLPGCAGFRAAPASPIPDEDAAITGLSSNFAPATVTDCLATPLGGQTPCRDKIVQSLMAAIDLRYAAFEVEFFNANRYGNFAATVTTLGLSAAGTVSGATAARAISAAIGAVTGTREAFNRDVLADQTSAALLTAMRAQRNIAAVRLREGLALPAERYPLGVAMSDLQAYFRGGTLPGALAGVTQAVGTQADAVQAELRNAIPVARGNAARALQQMIGDPSLTAEQRRANRLRIRRAMDAEGIPTSVLVSEFAADTSREAQQMRVLERVRAQQP